MNLEKKYFWAKILFKIKLSKAFLAITSHLGKVSSGNRLNLQNF